MPDSALEITITRDPDTGGVVAYGGDLHAHSLLQRAAGFIPVTEGRDAQHRLPAGLHDLEQEREHAMTAVAALAPLGYQVVVDEDLASRTLITAPRPPLGGVIHALTGELATAEHTREVSEILAQFTAPGDGILPAAVMAVEAAADWWDGLGESADAQHADRLRALAQQLETCTRELGQLRGDLADRHAPHPGHRSRPTDGPEQDRSAERARAATHPSPRREQATTPTPSPQGTPSISHTSPAGSPPRRR